MVSENYPRQGATYDVPMPDGKPLYVTVNGERGKTISEIFIRQDEPEMHELTTAVSRLVSMALREGVAPQVVAAELEAIHSPFTSHLIPGSTEICPSLTARVGITMKRFLGE